VVLCPLYLNLAKRIFGTHSKGLAAWPTLHLINDITYSFNRSCQTADVHENKTICRPSNIKGKVFPYLLPSIIGPGADPGVQAVSPQVT